MVKNIINTVNTWAEERRLDVSELSERQLLVPLLVFKVYEFLKREGEEARETLGHQVEEFTKFRQDLLKGEVRPFLHVTPLLVAHFLIKNQNKPLSITQIREKLKLSNFFPNVKYAIYKKGLEYTVDKSPNNFNLIESVQYYPSCNDLAYLFMRSPSYSQVFLGKEFSLDALSKISKRYGPAKICSLVEKFVDKRIERIEELGYADSEFRARLLRDAAIKAREWAYKHNRH